MHAAWGYDSLMYASTHTLYERTGHLELMSLFPPGLPLLIFVTGTGAGLLAYNCVVAWANALVVHRLALEVTGSALAALAVQIWVGLSLGSLSVFSFVWSEPTFCLAVNVALLALTGIWKTGITRELLATLILAANVAGLFRYAVISLVVMAGAATCVPCIRRSGRIRGLTAAAVVAMLSSLSVCVVMVYNVAEGEPAMGPRMPSVYSAADVLRQVGQVAAQIFLNVDVSAPPTLGLMILAGLAIATCSWAARQGISGVWHNHGTPTVAWTVGYVSFMALSELNNDLNGLDFRLLSPIIGSAAVAAALVLIGPLRRLPKVAARGAVVGYLLIVAGAATVWTVKAMVTGVPTWLPDQPEVDQMVATWVSRDVPAGATLTSDDPWRLAWATQRDEVRGVPDSGPYPRDTPEFTPRLQASYAKPGDYVVLFFSKPAPGLVPLHIAPTFAIYRMPRG